MPLGNLEIHSSRTPLLPTKHAKQRQTVETVTTESPEHQASRPGLLWNPLVFASFGVFGGSYFGFRVPSEIEHVLTADTEADEGGSTLIL
jgi:hypothetical protein